MTITIDLSDEKRERLSIKAAARGQDLTQYVKQLIDRDAEAPPSILEAAKPFADAVAASAITDEELAQTIDEVREEIWRETHPDPPTFLREMDHARRGAP